MQCDGLPSGIVALPQEVRSSAIGRVMFGMVDRYLRGENPFQLRWAIIRKVTQRGPQPVRNGRK